MKVKVVNIFVLGVCCIMPLAAATNTKPKNPRHPTKARHTTGPTPGPTPCTTPECFDCTQCEVDCNTVVQACDSDCLAEARKFVCNLENRNCKEVHGCNVPSVDVTFWPAAGHQTSNPAWLPQTISVRPNCCYDLSGPHDNTTSGITTTAQCIMLYDGHGCNGESLVFDDTWSQQCIDDFSCPEKAAFNDKTSSFRLC